MMYLNGMLISFIYLLYSKKNLSLIVSSIILIICIFSFLSFLYPPFEIPLVYLYLAILIGYLVKEKNFKLIFDRWKIKVFATAIVFLLLGFILFHYYQIAKDTFSMMMNTVYPGRRFSTGGDLLKGKVFADFFSMFMTDTHTPTQWQNICEASGAIMFFPIIFYGMGYYYFKTKKTDPLLISLSIFLVVGLIYVLLGFPAFLSKLSLFSMSPAFRTLPVVAIGNCVLLIGFLGSSTTLFKKEKISWIEFGILVLTTFLFISIVSSNINKATEKFFTSEQTIIVTALVIISYLLIRYKNFPFTKFALSVVLLIMTIKEIATNPLTRGLAAILENPLTQVSRGIHEKDPNARWALFGNVRLTHLLKANGINILNGVKYVPALEDMRKLDKARIYDSIYNRYSWVTMGMYIDWKDTIIFKQSYQDGYVILMDPCSPKFKELGVKYIVYDYKPQDPEIRCMTKVGETSGIFIYKRNDE